MANPAWGVKMANESSVFTPQNVHTSLPSVESDTSTSALLHFLFKKLPLQPDIQGN